ncbi:MAG: HAMP domain-containing protein [Ignavibacteriales bacterium]|nr:HAMP domain-containing protein [Ignavibacteriales bacterium]
MARAAQRIAQGDYSQAVDAGRGDDELGYLAHSFNNDDRRGASWPHQALRESADELERKVEAAHGRAEAHAGADDPVGEDGGHRQAGRPAWPTRSTTR